jgi:DNA-binding transcriptional ArsR family regulator
VQQRDEPSPEAKARALSSPLRMRILRYCLHEARTNREIAERFDLNPGSSIHHVRTLLDTGFLVPEAPRTGRRGALEQPYRATGGSWRTPVPNIGPILVQILADEIVGVPEEELLTARLGLKINAEHERELRERLLAVLQEFKERGPDDDGRPVSVFVAEHPEVER